MQVDTPLGRALDLLFTRLGILYIALMVHTRLWMRNRYIVDNTIPSTRSSSLPITLILPSSVVRSSGGGFDVFHVFLPLLFVLTTHHRMHIAEYSATV